MIKTAVRSPRAFTLIELLIVVAIIAILAAIALPNLLEAQTRAKVSRAKNDLRVLATATTIYYTDKNAWPPDNFPGQQLDVESYHFLTTPIAYLSSVPGNPFSEDTPPAQRRSREYEYWLGSVNGAGQQQYDPGAGSNGVYARFSSVGPDGQSDVAVNWIARFSPLAIAIRAPEFLNAIYDPTNGTTSAGDVLGSNRGLEPM